MGRGRAKGGSQMWSESGGAGTDQPKDEGVHMTLTGTACALQNNNSLNKYNNVYIHVSNECIEPVSPKLKIYLGKVTGNAPLLSIPLEKFNVQSSIPYIRHQYSTVR